MTNKAKNKKLQHWKIYALGGGLGHLHRSLAFSRRAIQKGHSVDIICNSRFSKFIPWKNELKESGKLTIINNKASVKTTSDKVIEWIFNDSYDQLIVDTLPRGITGELADVIESIKKPKTLIHRDLNHRYVEEFELSEFIKKYDLIIIPGEKNPIKKAKELSFCQTTEPWLIRDHGELLDKESARIQLGIDPLDKRPLAIIPLTGNSEEVDFFREVHSRLAYSITNWSFKLINPTPNEEDLDIWPLMELMNGVDLIIGAGGYNTVNECKATKTPLLGKPLKRVYDMQRGRLENHQIFRNIKDLINVIPSFEKNSNPSSFVNGTSKSVELIESLLI